MGTRDQTPGPRLATAAPAAGVPGHYVDWAAILGGAVVAVALGLLATGFGAALGLTALSAEEGEGSGVLAMVISAVWILASMVASYAAGGYIAGRMRRRLDTATGDEVTVRDGMNGLVVWGVGTILSAMILASAVSSTIGAVGSATAAVGETVGAAVGGLAQGAGTAAASLAPEGGIDPTDFISRGLMRPTAPATGEAAAGEDAMADVTSILGNVLATGEISDADRAYLVQATAARTGLAPAEVEARVDQAVTSATTARDEAAQLAQTAEETARNAAETARISAILTAFLLTAAALVAAVAAYVCAVKGGRHRDEGRVFGGFSYRH